MKVKTPPIGMDAQRYGTARRPCEGYLMDRRRHRHLTFFLFPTSFCLYCLYSAQHSLHTDSFRYYVVQDALYLKDFADCLRRLATTAPTPADATRLEAFAKGAEEAELSLHNSFFTKWNISADGAIQMPHTLLYTSYMKRIVATRSHDQGLAVLLPCFWVYMHVGKCMLKLREELGETVVRPEPYDAWIDMYAGDEFENEVKDYIAMVNRACLRLQQQESGNDNDDDNESSKQEQLDEMKRLFLLSCKLEHMFWDQASTMMTWPNIGGM
jgi:thiaminase (transcriptional activator TenA)